MAKAVPEHKDILGQELKNGSYVAIARRNDMKICCIVKITPKQLRVVPIKGRMNREWAPTDGWLVYPTDTVLLSGEDAVAYILKNTGT